MDIVKQLGSDIKSSIKQVFDYEIKDEHLLINPTKKEFDGEYTFVVFPLVKELKKSPQDIADTLGQHLVDNNPKVVAYNVIKGFLNLSLDNQVWSDTLRSIYQSDNFGQWPAKGESIIVEYSSPNTNKPLHLGHIRNILLGWSMTQIAEANGYKVIKTKVVNDRGIAICKSMLSWQKFGNGDTPESTQTKGDHFVGDYYVKFEAAFQEEYKNWQNTDEGSKVYNEHNKEGEDQEGFFKRYKNTYFNSHSSIGGEAREMLLKWEDGDPEVKSLWEKMNGWVYSGFKVTYKDLGVSFDDIVYESDTYLLGKDFVKRGLDQNIFYQKDDNSVWVDLEAEGMDQKIVLRSDGTSVYITQDLGTANVRYEKYKFDHMVYVVADEQDYHFQVLFKVLEKLGESYAKNLHHLSYGMVDLTTGKMKSREGTVVDADDLMVEVIETARQSALERGGLEGIDEAAQNDIYRKIGMGALKFFMVKINPRKRMTFDPEESLDMQGATGPYIQNAYVRIQSIFRKIDQDLSFETYTGEISSLEKELMVNMLTYPEVLQEAMQKYDPSVIANYCFNLAKSFHRFYHEHRILNAESDDVKNLRLVICSSIAKVLKQGMSLLGIEMPEYM